MASLAEGQRPVLTKDELVLLCLQFGIKFDENDPKSYSMLASYDDANYRIKSNDGSGRRFVLKISNSSEKIELLQMQQTILVFLEQNKDKFSSKSSLFPIVIPLSKSIEFQKEMNVKHLDDYVCDIELKHTKQRHFVRLLTFIEGEIMGNLKRRTMELFNSFGFVLGCMNKLLLDTPNLEKLISTASTRQLEWDLKNAMEFEKKSENIVSPALRKIAHQFFSEFNSKVVPMIPKLRKQLIHGDANDYNVVADSEKLLGVFDFGDLTYTCTIFEIAIAMAYAMMPTNNDFEHFEKFKLIENAHRDFGLKFFEKAVEMLRAYHKQHKLKEEEIDILTCLIGTRLSVSLSSSSTRQKLEPENTYISVSQRGCIFLLSFFSETPRFVIDSYLRSACGFDIVQNQLEISNILNSNQNTILQTPSHSSFEIFNLDVGSPLTVLEQMQSIDLDCIGVGKYAEPRFKSDISSHLLEGCVEANNIKSITCGLEFYTKPYVNIFPLFDGKIVFIEKDKVVFEHKFEVRGEKTKVWSIFRNIFVNTSLSKGVILKHRKGSDSDLVENLVGLTQETIPLQIQISRINPIQQKGGEDGESTIVVPFFVSHSEFENVYRHVCPLFSVQNLLTEISISDLTFKDPMTSSEILEIRTSNLSPNLSLSYSTPLTIVRGSKEFLIDKNGRIYLDCVNNVCHVGHSHPAVVRAASLQMRVLNTNTRYLHQNIALLTKKLLRTLPPKLSVCFFVCSGSEANELALRLAKTHTNAQDVIVPEMGYFGNTNSLVSISPYKFDRKGGKGSPQNTHKVVLPNTYRPPKPGISENELVDFCVSDIQNKIKEIKEKQSKLAAFFCESIPGCAGQVVLPNNYLKRVYSEIRAAGGVCVADEVQVGCGRVGSNFWAFQNYDVIPDIVTMGKPVGNGHPIGVVVTTREIADSFNNGMEYFNTFGGNPVSCAVMLEVFNVIEKQKLQQNSLKVGNFLMQKLKDEIQSKFEIVGDVRGFGLFIGIEIVKDRVSKLHNTFAAKLVVELMKEEGILLSTDGPENNVIKFKPPITFNENDAEYFVRSFHYSVSQI